MVDLSSTDFQDNALFRDIPVETLKEAEVSIEEISLEADQIVFDEGDAPDYCYLVKRGAIRITKAGSGGRQELLSIIEAGNFFGELALYAPAPRSARATAAVPTSLGRLDRRGFDRLREIAPLPLASILADVSIERVRQTNERFVQELAATGRLSELGADLGTLSHNLRSPLGTIRNAADMLVVWLEEGSQDAGKLLGFVQIIQRTSDKALEHIDQLLARLRGEGEPARELVKGDDLLADLREQTRGMLREGVEYSENVTFDGAVLVDRAEWVAALANLVKNSVEAIPPSGGNVEVAVGEEDGEVVFSVSDNGCGIPPEKLPRFFDRRFTHGKEGGTGLGTAHARTVVEKHGGQANVYSEVGRGTTVELRIPQPKG